VNYLERNILQNDDGVLGRVLFKQGLEVGGAGRQDHLVSLAGLSVASLETKIRILKTHLLTTTKYMYSGTISNIRTSVELKLILSCDVGVIVLRYFVNYILITTPLQGV